jgi:hypothetical protein
VVFTLDAAREVLRKADLAGRTYWTRAAPRGRRVRRTGGRRFRDGSQPAGAPRRRVLREDGGEELAPGATTPCAS